MSFDKPLDTWVEEEVEIPSFEAELNSKGEVTGLKQTTRKSKVKTIYSNPTASRFSCLPGQHNWSVMDKHRHIASCPNCLKNRFIRPVFEYIKNGVIYSLDNHEMID